MEQISSLNIKVLHKNTHCKVVDDYAKFVFNIAYNYKLIKKAMDKDGSNLPLDIGGKLMDEDQCTTYVDAFDYAYQGLDLLYQEIFLDLVFPKSKSGVKYRYAKSTYYRYRKKVFLEFLWRFLSYEKQ